MDPLPPIPSPPEHHWREFRIRYLPAVVFAGVLAASVVVWQEKISPPTLVGEVETIRASVSSPLGGAVAELRVGRFDRVTAGQIVGHITANDPRLLSTALDIIRAESDLVRNQLAPSDAQQRIQLNYQRLRLDVLNLRAQLAVARVQLAEAENEFNRVARLFADKIAAEFEYQRAESVRNAKREEVSELQHIVEENQKTLASEQPVFDENISAAAAQSLTNLSAAIALHEKKITAIETLTLIAPTDGYVSAIHRRPGENVLAGEPILTISALNATRIVGFLRQPLNLTPTAGMTIEVRSRSGARSSAPAKILEVGTQLEPINPELLPSNQASGGGRPVENGLPVLIGLPTELRLVPGEIVDLVLRDGR